MRISFLGWTALIFGAGCGGETDKSSPETLMSRFCEDVIQLPCWRADNAVTQAECEGELQEARTDAGGDGCLAEFDAVLGCAAAHPMSCSDDGPELADSCAPHSRAWEECHDIVVEPPVTPPSGSGGAGGAGGGAECSMGIGSGGANSGVTCTHQCGSYAARCDGPSEGQSGPLVCECTAGPQTGFGFNATDCGSSMIAASNAFCGAVP